MQGDSVYTMALNEEKLVVGTAGRRTLVWDLRNMSTALQKRESSLKYQTRCIKCFPSRQGFVLSSIEGKDIVKQFNLHEVQNVTLYFISPLLFF
jgi:cell cycle arrest protein BUB3